MSNLQINTRVRRLFYYLEDFEKGLIRIPLFQRDSVWNDKKKLELFDSIKKGYPIGSILFWRPEVVEDVLSSDYEIKSIGSYIMNERANDFFYILDGFQRLSTLFGCLISPEKTKLERDDDEWFNSYNIIYNLEKEVFEINKKKDFKNLDIYKIPLYKLVDTKEFYKFQTNLLKLKLADEKIFKYLKNYEDVGFKFVDYNIPSIDLIGGNIKEAIDIFSRVNSAGSKISDEWKLSALKSSNNFRLGSLINETLLEVNKYKFYDKKKLNSFRELIFRCVQSSFGNLYLDNQKTSIYSLEKINNFEEIVFKTLNISIIKTVEFLIVELGVFNYDMLPASMQFIFLVEFFNNNDSIDEKNKKELKKWFWQTTYSNYFTIYNPSKRKRAFEHFRLFTIGNDDNSLFVEKNNFRFVVPELPEKITFGSVRSKAYLLFLLNYLNGFKEFNLEERNEFSQEKLFKEYDSPENVIIKFKFIDLKNNYDQNLKFNDITRKPKKALDFSIMLKSAQNFEGCFINDEMKNLYKTDVNSKERILHLRKEYIKQEEQKFVNNLSIIDYNQ
ncbi:DUF262 domain-containing protein [Flavobacterium sp. SUN046]|uniref:DUF262 domain-containing protein n=1 Tax=Flavobacterium sp. SUN046 TaxID=3002440 RepID=UPI002DBC7ADA|nr:DUF262 domain-containing protein [Flavobacterium sp. SUN046]MEC4050311.1 DUF262 domain-containing protein [Flavobacterium sp. SUN046]